MTKKTEGLRFDYLEIENFKSIDKKIVEINGKSFLITGKNGEGKSSLIQALLSGIDPKSQPTQTIKNGESKASTKVKLSGIMNGVEEEYTLDMYYTAKNQKGRLVLTNSAGETVKSPASVLKSIVGNISFDIFKFLNATKREQIKVLKELSGVSVEIDRLDMERKKIFDERTYLNRSVAEDESVMNNHGLTPQEIDIYSDPMDIEPLQEELNGISKKISTYNDVKSRTADFGKRVAEMDKANDDCREEIEHLKKKIIEYSEKIDKNNEVKLEAANKHDKGLEWLAKNTEPSAAEVSERLSSAMLHNSNHKKVNDLADKQKKLIKDKQRLEGLTADIEKVDDKKSKVIKSSKLPIKGLTFSDEEIFLDGLPFEEGQINTAKLIDVGLEISMALNPNLRVVFLHEGSLFDKEALNNLIKKVEDRGYQLIAEVVSDEKDLSITFTEEVV